MNRRKILCSVSGIIIGSLAITGGTSAASLETREGTIDGLEYEQLKGSSRNPVSTSRVRALQKTYAERIHDRSESSVAFLDVESTFDDDTIIAYNVIVGHNDRLREQFVTAGSSPEEASTERVSAETTERVSAETTERRHRKADALLEQAGEQEKIVAQTSAVSASSSWDIDWDEWAPQGSTDIYWEPDEEVSYNAKVGNVEFTHDVRRSSDYDRIEARSKIRMEPGRQLCNDGLDDYCTSSVQDGYSNKEATVHHDWDQWVNDVPQDDLIVSTDPEGQISDVTSTRGYSLGLDIAKEPSLTIGFNSSVSFPGAQLTDKTSKTTGRSEHALEMNSADSSSASNNAVFEVGSIAAYEKGCFASPPLYERTLLEIDVDLEWGLNVPVGDYGHTESTTKSFEYATWC